MRQAMDCSARPHPVTEDDIAHFLVKTPSFFERHAELLERVQLSHPHGPRVVSLPLRQAELLRRKISHLEHRLADLVGLCRDNSAIVDKLQHCTEALLRARSARELPVLLEAELKARFDLPQVALRLWGLAPEFAEFETAPALAEPARTCAAALTRPYCGPVAGQPARDWLDEPEAAASLALLALRADPGSPPFGLLLLASDDLRRFEPGMETDFLGRFGELAGTALARLLPDPLVP